jgi:hypothetical protein
MNPSPTTHLFFVDWLRVFALGVLWWYHSGLIFSEKTGFHIKNNEPILYLDHFLFFFHEWRLALLFFVSGVAGYYVGQKYGKRFLAERWKRLCIPLLFGVLVIVPPQIYIERIFNGFAYQSYYHFYIQSFQNGFYPHGDISWHHLWFMAYLLCYVSIFTLAKNIFARFRVQSNFYLSPFIWVLPLVIAEILLKPYSTGVQNIVQDLAKFTSYFILYLYGFFIASKPLYWDRIKSQKYTSLVAVVCSFILIYWIRMSGAGLADGVLSPFYTAIRAINTWLCILVLIGFAATYFNFNHRWLSTMNRAILPMYILHQTAIIVIGYQVIGLSMNPAMKWLLVMLFSFLFSWLIYRYIIAKVGTIAFLFGLKNG